MVGMILANVHVGVSNFHGNEVFTTNFRRSSVISSGFSLESRPSMGIGWKVRNTRLKRGLVFKALLKEGSDGKSVSGSVLKTEFEFKPSFDEYLKVMESVKTVREKKLDSGSEKKKTLHDENEVDEKMKVSEGSLEGEKKFRVVEKDGLVKTRNGFKKQDNERKNIAKLKGGFSGKVRTSVGMTNGKFVKDGTEGRWPRQQTRVKEVEEDGDDYSVRMRRENGSLETWRKKRNDSSLPVNRSMSEVNVRNRINVVNNDVHKGVEKNGIQYENAVGKDEYRQKHERVNGRNDSRRGYQSISEVDEREKTNVRSTEADMGFEDNTIEYDKAIGEDDLRPKNERISWRTKVVGVDDRDINDDRAVFKIHDESNDVMDGRRHPRVEMDERIQKLAMSLNGADVNMPEWVFSKMMRSAKIIYTDHSFSRLIQILGKLGNWRRVLQVIEWLQIRERFKSHKLRYIYTTALCVLGKAKRPVEALNVFNAMQQQMSSYPDLVAYHSIAVTLGQAGHMKELFDVIDTMRSPPKKNFKTGALVKWDPRLEPDMIVYNAVLNACVQRKQWEGAFWVLQQLKEKSLQPSVTTYGLVMEVMFTCGKYNLVHDFFRKLQKSSMPNALTYRVLVNTLWKEGKLEEAIQAIKDMEKRGIVGSAALYYDFARCLCSAGRSKEALKQIEKICKVANKPLVVTYTGLIQACIDSGNIKDGAYIFRHMQDFCSPNLVTCNIMLKGYLKHGMFEEGKELFQRMLENRRHIKNKNDQKVSVLPDIYTFNTLLDACAAEERWDDFEYAYEKMLHHGFHFNSKRHLPMILGASRAGKRELVEVTWTHLIESDRTPPLSLVKERFRMKLEKEDYASALSCICSQNLSASPEFSKKAWSKLLDENSVKLERGTLHRLIQEITNIIARTDQINPSLDNLLASCKELCRTSMVAISEPTDACITIHDVPSLKL